MVYSDPETVIPKPETTTGATIGVKTAAPIPAATKVVLLHLQELL